MPFHQLQENHCRTRHHRHALRDAHTLGTIRSRRNGSVLFWILGLMAILSVVSISVYLALVSNQGEEVQVLTHTVARATYAHDVVEEGEIESSSNVEIRCEVKSRNSSGTMIIEVVPEGTNVEKGDVLVRLDASALEQERVQQQITCNTAEAKMIQSKNTWEAAQIALKEYVEGTFFQEEQQIQSEIFIAEENLRRAQEYVKYSQRLAARGYVTEQQLEGDQFAVEKAKTELETAKTKLRVLQEYTKPKMVKQLESDIRTAEANYRSDQSSYELELNNLKEIEEQIARCEIVAPQSGQVVHANETSRRGESDFIVEPGAMVREGQGIIKLPDPSRMEVKAKISESRVNLVKVGMPVSIRVDALGDKTLKGRVVKVNEYPEPTSWFSSQVKEYATNIQVLDPPSSIRPGLTAEVTIHVDRVDNAIVAPVQTVHEHGRKLYCMVQDGENWRAQEIEILGSNDTYVRIESGLQPGDVIAMAPRELLELVDLPELQDAETEEGPGALVLGDQSGSGTAGGESGGGPAGSSPAGGGGPGGAAAMGGGPAGGGPAGGEPPSPAAIVGMIFARSDTNGDGVIDSSEMTDENRERLLRADGNGDGKVDRAEMTSAMARMGGGPGGGPPGGGPASGPRGGQ